MDIPLKETKSNVARKRHSYHEYSAVPPRETKAREEKPWRRVVFEIGRKGTHLYEPVKSVPSTLLIVLLAFYVLLGYIAQLVEDDMVRVITDAEISHHDATLFSEEMALRYLTRIVGDEPRVCGTPYHLNKTQDLKAMVDEIASASAIPVHSDWQMSSADFWMNQIAPHVVYYHNESNIIALLEGQSGFNGQETSSSVLVNCHYDSVPYALGASDDAVFCAVMMETLSRLSRRQQRFKHNIIFLFNGAEENGLQGSHAFLRHPWARGVTSVVNLDAAGMNGKPTLFQVTDSRILKIFNKRIHKPNAQALGEILFLSGVIPSDTDFRIWKSFGGIQGADVAYTKWGHVYHTRYDVPELVQSGVVQISGDMLLTLLSEMADSEEFGVKGENEMWVYYDYLNVFMVTYSSGVAYVIDTFVVLVGALSVLYYVWVVGFRRTTFNDLLFCMVGRIATAVSGALLVLLLTSIMVLTTVQLRYLTNPWIVIAVFWVPYLIGAVAASQIFDGWRSRKSGLNRSIRTVEAMAATRVFLIASIIVLLCIPGTSVLRYLLVVPLLILSVCSSVSLTILRVQRLKGWQHLILELVLSLPTLMWLNSLAIRMNALLLPVMGRTPVDNPDLLVALMNLGLVILISSAASGIELMFSRKRLWMVLSAVLAVCFAMMLIPFNPYSDEGPAVQRHYWFHTEIQSFNFEGVRTSRTSGVLVTKHDAYTIDYMKRELQARSINLNIRTDFQADCETRVYCDLPIYRPRFESSLGDSLFLYMNAPAPFDPTPSLTATRACYQETCVLDFAMMGAPHNIITLWPADNINITSWSLSSPLQATLHQLGRPVYVIVHSVATFSDVMDGLRFTITMKVPLSQQSQPILSVSHHAHRLHHPQYYTEEYRNLVNAMPKYFNIATTITFRSNYEF